MATAPQTIKLTILYQDGGGAVQSTKEIIVNPASDLRSLIDLVKDDYSNVVSLGMRVLYKPGEDEQLDKTLTDCDIADGFCISVFSSETEYHDTFEEKSHMVPLHAADHRIRGKFTLSKFTNDINGSFCEAVSDSDGKDLFSPANVFQVVNQALNQVAAAKGNFIYLRNLDGTLTPRTLRTRKGKQLKAVLRTIHYNLNAPKRFSSKEREVMVRAVMYTYKSTFDKKNYNNEIRAILDVLSLGLRIKVGNEWIPIPARAFNLVSEIKGVFDGDLKIEYKIGDRTVTFDCGHIVNKIHNNAGYSVVDYYKMSLLGIGTRYLEMDSVIIKTKAKYLLLVEDGGVFKYLREVQIWEYLPVVLVCTHGYSDLETRAFVHMLHKHVGLSVFGFFDMNVGGIDIMNQFGVGNGGYSSEKDLFCTTKVKWIGLRPSQLEKLRTSGHQEAKTLMHKIHEIASVFSIRKNTRLDNHINEETSWIQNGEVGRRAHRKGEMEAMKKDGRGVDVESAEDDQVIKLILKQLLKIWGGQDNDEDDYAFV